MNKMEVIWKPVEDYEDLYMVSNTGLVKRLKKSIIFYTGSIKVYTEKVLYGYENKVDGYVYYGLTKDDKQRKFKIHRLVAKAFIPNPENKPQVNHINGIKTDNRVENLEWCTSSENHQHAWDIGLKKYHPAKMVFNTETGIYYDTQVDAAASLGITISKMTDFLNGIQKNRSSCILI